MRVGYLVVAVPISLSLLWAAVGLCGGGPSQDRPATPESPPRLHAPTLPRAGQQSGTYVFQATPEVLAQATPAQVMVFRVVEKEPTRDMVCELAARAGVSVPPQRYAVMAETAAGQRAYRATVGGPTATSLGDLDVDLCDDGIYQLTWRSRMPIYSRDAPEPASQEVARAAAEDFLATSGLLPTDCQFASVEEGDAIEFTTQEGVGQKRVLGLAVCYHRYLDGIGAGSFEVRVNGQGQVYTVTRHIRDVAAWQPYPILSPSEVIQALNAGEGVVMGPGVRSDDAAVAVIDSLRLSYYEESMLSDQEILQLVYRASGTVQGAAGKVHALLPAVRPEYLEPPVLPHPGGAPK